MLRKSNSIQFIYLDYGYDDEGIAAKSFKETYYDNTEEYLEAAEKGFAGLAEKKKQKGQKAYKQKNNKK